MKEVRVVAVGGGRRRFVGVAVLLLAVVAIALASYSLGVGHARALLKSNAALKAAAEEAEDAKQIAQSALIDAQISSQVGTATNEELQDTISEMQAQQATLREEVTFYRSLMAPSSLERGLQIAKFGLLSEGAARIRYELLLTQVETRRSVMQGTVLIDVVGSYDGEEVVLPLTDLVTTERYPLKYRFRYFQDFGGTMRLPEGFQPERVVVTVTRKGGGDANLQRTFDWEVEVG